MSQFENGLLLTPNSSCIASAGQLSGSMNVVDAQSAMADIELRLKQGILADIAKVNNMASWAFNNLPENAPGEMIVVGRKMSLVQARYGVLADKVIIDLQTIQGDSSLYAATRAGPTTMVKEYVAKAIGTIRARADELTRSYQPFVIVAQSVVNAVKDGDSGKIGELSTALDQFLPSQEQAQYQSAGAAKEGKVSQPISKLEESQQTVWAPGTAKYEEEQKALEATAPWAAPTRPGTAKYEEEQKALAEWQRQQAADRAKEKTDRAKEKTERGFSQGRTTTREVYVNLGSPERRLILMGFLVAAGRVQLQGLPFNTIVLNVSNLVNNPANGMTSEQQWQWMTDNENLGSREWVEGLIRGSDVLRTLAMAAANPSMPGRHEWITGLVRAANAANRARLLQTGRAGNDPNWFLPGAVRGGQETLQGMTGPFVEMIERQNSADPFIVWLVKQSSTEVLDAVSLWYASHPFGAMPAAGTGTKPAKGIDPAGITMNGIDVISSPFDGCDSWL